MLVAAFLGPVAASASADAVAGAFRIDPPLPSSSRSILLTPSQMLSLADVANTKGDARTAFRIYAALEANPSSDVRNEARFRHAKLLITGGKTSQAAVLLRRILDEKPDAAPVRLALAQVLQGLGDLDAALRELRAAEAAGLPSSVARIVDRYSEALRAQRSFGASFEIALAPDSNINHATRSDTLGTVLGDFDIDPDSKAKSGTGLSLRGQIYRRFRLGDGANNLLARASAYADLYLKGQFNDFAVDVATGPELRFGRNRLSIEIGATQRWYGQKPFEHSARLGATWMRSLGFSTQLRLSGSASRVDNRMNDLQDGKTYSGKLSVERALSPTTGVALSFGLDRQSLKDPAYSTTGWRGSATAWREIGRMTLTAGLELGRLHADERLRLFPDRREDRYSRLSIGATFRQLQFRGFAPVTRFSVESNKSSIEFYDYHRTRTEVGLVRAF